MITVSKPEFDAFVLANVGLLGRAEPRIERDGEYKYECYDNEEGAEIAFVAYRVGEEPTYSIRGEKK